MKHPLIALLATPSMFEPRGTGIYDPVRKPNAEFLEATKQRTREVEDIGQSTEGVL